MHIKEYSKGNFRVSLHSFHVMIFILLSARILCIFVLFVAF